MANPDGRVASANKLGALVTFDHPVKPRRDRFGHPTCPVCANVLSDPIYSAGRGLPPASDGRVVTSLVIFQGACGECRQVITWAGWAPTLSDEERAAHVADGCKPPLGCFRCRQP